MLIFEDDKGFIVIGNRISKTTFKGEEIENKTTISKYLFKIQNGTSFQEINYYHNYRIKDNICIVLSRQVIFKTYGIVTETDWYETDKFFWSSESQIIKVKDINKVMKKFFEILMNISSSEDNKGGEKL